MSRFRAPHPVEIAMAEDRAKSIVASFERNDAARQERNKLLPAKHDPRRVFADALFAAVDNLATLAELDRGELPESIAVAARAFVAAEETTR